MGPGLPGPVSQRGCDTAGQALVRPGPSRGNRRLLNRGGGGERLVPTRLPGPRLNAICSAGPWKNILLGGLERGRQRRGVGAGREQGPDLLNK